MKATVHFSEYVKVACKLLLERGAKEILLQACGSAMTTLFKVSAVLSEYIPELQSVNSFDLSECHICMKNIRATNATLLSKEEAVKHLRPKLGAYEGSTMHKCNRRSFPYLILHKQKLSLKRIYDPKDIGY